MSGGEVTTKTRLHKAVPAYNRARPENKCMCILQVWVQCSTGSRPLEALRTVHRLGSKRNTTNLLQNLHGKDVAFVLSTDHSHLEHLQMHMIRRIIFCHPIGGIGVAQNDILTTVTWV